MPITPGLVTSSANLALLSKNQKIGNNENTDKTPNKLKSTYRGQS